MYLTLGLAAAYTISSYSYDYYQRTHSYYQETDVSLAAMRGKLGLILNSIPSEMYKFLLSDNLNLEIFCDKMTNFGQSLGLITFEYPINGINVNIDACFARYSTELNNYVQEFGVHNMQAVLNSILEGEDLETLPYIYIPYHQYIKSAIAVISISEIIYSKFDTIKWTNDLVNDYQSGCLGVAGIIGKYGIESIPLLRIMRANFSELYGFNIVSIARANGKGALELLKDAGADLGMLGPDDIAQLIINYGLEIIPLLVDILGVKLSKMGKGDIFFIADKYGKDSIELLKNAGADVSNINEDYSKRSFSSFKNSVDRDDSLDIDPGILDWILGQDDSNRGEFTGRRHRSTISEKRDQIQLELNRILAEERKASEEHKISNPMEVKVVRHNDNLLWITDIFPHDKVTVYNMGPDDLVGLPDNIIIINCAEVSCTSAGEDTPLLFGADKISQNNFKLLDWSYMSFEDREFAQLKDSFFSKEMAEKFYLRSVLEDSLKNSYGNLISNPPVFNCSESGCDASLGFYGNLISNPPIVNW